MTERSLSWFTNHLKIPVKQEKIITGVEFDSRKVQPGNLFFALKGKQVDGHSFLKEVAAKGALGAVVSSSYSGEDFGLLLLRVENVTEALQHLATKEIEERKIPVVALTGSVGKTTTKEFLTTLLQARFRVFKTPGNSNSQVGLPAAILNAPKEVDLFVIEMGMTGPGEISKLTLIAPPDFALITRVGVAHVGYFADGELGVAKAKAEIFSHPKTKLGLYNSDNRNLDPVLKTGKCTKHSFAFEKMTKEPADFLLRCEGEKFFIEEKGKKSPTFSLPFQATHLCEDFAAAACMARELGLSWEALIAQAQTLKPFKNRFEKIEREGAVFINDAYNANPQSMRAAFANLPQPGKGGRKIAVLGTMVELGDLSLQYHSEIGQEASQLFDHLLCFGKECLIMLDIFQKANLPVEHFTDLSTLKSRLFSLIRPHDLILIKGSNSTKLYSLLE